MSEIIKIGEKSIKKIDYKGKTVITAKMIAEVHGREVKRVNEQFRNNQEKFIENEDYFILPTKDLRSIISTANSAMDRSEDSYLFTESGYLMLVKTFNDEKSWEVQRILVNSYFKLKEIENLTEINQLKRLLSYSYYTPEKVISIIKWFYIHEHIATNSDMTREKIENMLRYINCNPPLKVNEICKLLDISKSTFYRYKKLIDEVYNNMGIGER